MGIVRLFLSLLILWLVYLGIFEKRGWLDYRRMTQKNQGLLDKLKTTAQQKKSLEKQILAMQTDPKEQERVVRERLGYIRPNETIIEFE